MKVSPHPRACSAPDQGKAVGVMAGTVPQDRFPELVAWMYPLLGNDDREYMTRIWQMVLLPRHLRERSSSSTRLSATISSS